jgi:GGDEF domain-containing protein
VRTASFLLAGLRHVDILFRISPDRLAALLPETPQEGASKAADRIRAYVGDVVSRFSFPVTLTIASMGWAADDDAPPETILQQLGAEAEGSPE